jgi:hypothetical protein
MRSRTSSSLPAAISCRSRRYCWRAPRRNRFARPSSTRASIRSCATAPDLRRFFVAHRFAGFGLVKLAIVSDSADRRRVLEPPSQRRVEVHRGPFFAPSRVATSPAALRGGFLLGRSARQVRVLHAMDGRQIEARLEHPSSQNQTRAKVCGSG